MRMGNAAPSPAWGADGALRLFHVKPVADREIEATAPAWRDSGFHVKHAARSSGRAEERWHDCRFT